jgi:hypothetical protein
VDDWLHDRRPVRRVQRRPDALPGATVLQLSERGLEQVEWQDLDLVDHWRRYLGDPRAYLRHVVE